MLANTSHPWSARPHAEPAVTSAAAQAASQARGPVQREERAAAPDLARGAMLLCIALANAAGVAAGGQPGIEVAPHGVEGALNLLMLVLVHARAYPVFAVMFGYGLVQLARRQEAAGASPAAVRAVLLRRNAWLVAFGVVHAALLYFGDFLGAYGIVGMTATVLLLHRGDRVHRVVLWLWALTAVNATVLAVVVAIGVASAEGSAPVPFTAVPSLVAPDYVTSLAARLVEWPRHTASVVPFIVVVWLGMWGARRRMLDAPVDHRRLLRLTAGAGLGIAFAGGLPLGLVSAGVLTADAITVERTVVLHQGTGMFGGPGYVALFALAAIRLSRPVYGMLALAADPLKALGQRSLSGYLFQSVSWLALLSPFTLDLARGSSSPLATALAVALVVWLASLAGAWALERHGRRGPAEALLRRLVYGGAAGSRLVFVTDPAEARPPDPAGHSLNDSSSPRM